MYMRLLTVAILIVCALIGWRFYSKITAFEKLAQAPHNQYVGPADNPALIITEIMDYRCPYCRAMSDTMTAYAARHPDVKIIYRVYPIFAEQSIREGKLAMAAGKQGKFLEMHNKLIRRTEPVTREAENELIKELGLDAEKFHQDVLAWDATKDLLDTAAAVEALGIKSTPTLIVNKQIMRMQDDLVPTLEDMELMMAPHFKPQQSTKP